jgi:hypothetical protein
VAAGGVVLRALMARYGVGAAALSSVIAAGASMLICGALAARTFPGLAAGLPRVLPVALGPPLATSLAAFAAARLLGPGHHGMLADMALEVAAGAGAFAVTVFSLRGCVIDILHSLNQPASRPAVQETKSPQQPRGSALRVRPADGALQRSQGGA